MRLSKAVKNNLVFVVLAGLGQLFFPRFLSAVGFDCKGSLGDHPSFVEVAAKAFSNHNVKLSTPDSVDRYVTQLVDEATHLNIDSKVISSLEDSFFKYLDELEKTKVQISQGDLLLLEERFEAYDADHNPHVSLRSRSFRKKSEITELEVKRMESRLQYFTEVLKNHPTVLKAINENEQKLKKVENIYNSTKAKIAREIEKIKNDSRTKDYEKEFLARLDYVEKYAKTNLKKLDDQIEVSKLCSDLRKRSFVDKDILNESVADTRKHHRLSSFSDKGDPWSDSVALIPDEIAELKGFLVRKIVLQDPQGMSDFLNDRNAFQIRIMKELDVLLKEPPLEDFFEKSPLPFTGLFASDFAHLRESLLSARESINQTLPSVLDKNFSQQGARLPKEIISQSQVVMNEIASHYSSMDFSKLRARMRTRDGGEDILIAEHPSYATIGLYNPEVEAHISKHFFKTTYDKEMFDILMQDNYFPKNFFQQIADQRVASIFKEASDKTGHSFFPPWIQMDVVFDALNAHEPFQKWRRSVDTSTSALSDKEFNVLLEGFAYSVRVAVCRSHACSGGYRLGELVTVFPVRGKEVYMYKKDAQGNTVLKVY
jgi:hypothetical protein